jgi:LPS sulfotransferase NodH
MRRFVIMALPRTGTTYLRVTLNQHANIVANNELLSPSDSPWWDPAPRAEMSNAELLRLGFRDFPRPESKTDVRAVGFKILDSHLTPGQGRPEFLDLISQDPDVRVLHLTRANPLQTLRSLAQAYQTRRWIARRACDLEDMPTVRLTPGQCRDFIERSQRFAAHVRHVFAEHHVLELVYEELCAEHEEQARRVQEFLDVPVRRLPLPYVLKQEVRNLPDVVENYPELRDAFRGSEYERLFA